MAWKHAPGHKATLDLIKSCAASGAGIEHIDAAPRFRFEPVPRAGKDSFHPPAGDWGRIDGGPPSNRGSIACGNPKPKHLKNWNPTRLDANPMYHVGMAGDSRALTEARAAWARGNPQPLRDYLAWQQQREKEDVAA
jgi:hypothetical protein